MSNQVNDMIMEGLADEFFDDVPGAVSWLSGLGKDVSNKSESALLEMFVNVSMGMMPDGPQ